MQVPALGSPRDIIFRGYLDHEAKIEIKKHKLTLLMTLGTPFITEEASKKLWDDKAREIFSEYVSSIYGQEFLLKEEEDLEALSQKEKEEGLRKFYDEVVKNTQPKLSRDGQGSLHVTGVPKV